MPLSFSVVHWCLSGKIIVSFVIVHVPGHNGPLSVCLSVCLSVLIMNLPACIYIYLFICLSVLIMDLSACISICESVCLHVHIIACLSVRPDDPKSKVYGNVAFGVFDGFIHSRGDIYVIEPADR